MNEEQQQAMNELKPFIAALPGDDGWWKGSGESMTLLAKELVKLGMSVRDIKYHLQAIYYEVAAEFGN